MDRQTLGLAIGTVIAIGVILAMLTIGAGGVDKPIAPTPQVTTTVTTVPVHH